MKKVTIDFTIRLAVSDILEDELIEGRYNNGSWCAENLLDLIAEYQRERGDPCLCNIVSAKLVKE